MKYEFLVLLSMRDVKMKVWMCRLHQLICLGVKLRLVYEMLRTNFLLRLESISLKLIA